VVLAFLRASKPLPKKEAPYHIVVACDDRTARWICQVAKVALLDAPVPPPH